VGDSQSSSWMDDVAGAARAAWLGLETSALIASSPAAPIADRVPLADPTMDAGITALSEAHGALAEAATAKGSVTAKDPVDDGQTASLVIDPVAELGWGEDTGLTDNVDEMMGSDVSGGNGHF